MYLLTIPVALDLFLWLAPRLSVASLFNRLATFYLSVSQTNGLSGDMLALTQQASELIQQTGRESNLLHLLVSSSLLHVPSLAVTLQPQADVQVYEITSPSMMIGLFICFGLLSLLLGVLYLGMLARYLPIGEGEKPNSLRHFLRASVRRWILTVLYIFLVTFALFAIYTPAMLGISLIMLVVPALGSGLVLLLSGLTFVLYFYLYFTVMGFIVDDLSIFDAVVRSMQLVRQTFWATFGLIVLLNLISIGFSLLLGSIATQQPYSIIPVIIGNAYIGTGLAMAILIYYRTRLLQLNGEKEPVQI